MYVFQDIETSIQGLFIISKGTLFGLSLKNGNDLFSPISGVSSPPLFSEGMLFFGTAGGQLVEINSLNGAVLKSLYIGEKITTRPVLFGENLIAGTESGNIIVINPENM
jgi:outer membrane protein assembly factor BamB